jgi:hypothetical protein
MPAERCGKISRQQMGRGEQVGGILSMTNTMGAAGMVERICGILRKQRILRGD